MVVYKKQKPTVQNGEDAVITDKMGATGQAPDSQYNFYQNDGYQNMSDTSNAYGDRRRAGG
jgi:hypothetical protein